MKGYIITTVALFTMLIQCFSQVKLPGPIRYYPLDGNAKEVIERYDGDFRGDVQPFKDRFNNPGGAITFGKGGYVATPSFFDFTGSLTEATICFWMYVGTAYDKNSGVDPWTSEDQPFYAFYGSGDIDLMGFYHRRDRVVVDTGLKDSHAVLKNFGIWYWDPVCITNNTGWYMVAIGYESSKTHLTLFTPDGRMVEALTYFGFPDVKTFQSWSLGCDKYTSVKGLDDFRVYNVLLTREQLAALYGQTAPSAGSMYQLSCAFAQDRILRTKDDLYTYGAVDLFSRSEIPGAGDAMNQWVIDPISAADNVYRIRLPYVDGYYLCGHGQYKIVDIDLLTEESKWIITPTGDGYFYIKWWKDPELYLAYYKEDLSPRPTIVLNRYQPETAPYYKWRPELLYMAYDLQTDDFESIKDIEVIDNYNPTFGLIPQTPIMGDAAQLIPFRTPKPSFMNHYYMVKGLDNSYFLENRAYYEMRVGSIGSTTLPGTPVQLKKYRIGYAPYYLYLLKRLSRWSRRYYIVPIMGQNTAVASNDLTSIMDPWVTYNTEPETKPPSGIMWQFFRTGSRINGNVQLLTINPGLYKICLASDKTRCVASPKESFDLGTEIQLPKFDPNNPWPFYWYISPELDEYGKPVYDGTYTIRAFGRDALFLRVENPQLQLKSQIVYGHWSLDEFYTFKWIFKPGKTKNTYNILTSKYPPYGMVTWKGDDLELGVVGDEAHCKDEFILEPVNLQEPLQDGIYHIRLSFGNVCIRPVDGKVKYYQELEIYTCDNSKTCYDWVLKKNADGTYYISSRDNKNYCIGTENADVSPNTHVVLTDYDAEESKTMKWLITPSPEGPSGSYEVRLAGYPDLLYLHTYGNSFSSGSSVMVDRKTIPAGTIRWYFDRIE